MTKAFTALTFSFLISSCVNQKPAPIEYNEVAVNNFDAPKVIVRKKLMTQTVTTPEESNTTIKSLDDNDGYQEVKAVTTKTVTISKDKSSTVDFSNNNDKYQELTDIVIVPQEKEIQIKSLDDKDKYQEVKGKLKEPKHLQDQVLPPAPQNLKIIYHEAQEGETLADIAKNYSTSLEKLIEINKDLNPDVDLINMQIVKVPVTSDILNKKNRENAAAYKEQYKNNKTVVADAILIDKTKYINPLQGTVISTFSPLNAGINIAAEKGTPVMSIVDGVVIKIGNSPKYGNLIIIRNNDTDLNVAYAHLESINLKNGQKVTQGEVIGKVGDSGNVDSPQLYMAIKDKDKAVNPLLYIPGF